MGDEQIGALPDGTGSREPNPQAVSALRASIPNAELAAAWRCGVSTGVEVADRVMVLMKKSRSKAVHRYADLLDKLMQDVMDARHQHKVTDYRSAFEAHKAINVAAAAKAMEARNTPPTHGIGKE